MSQPIGYYLSTWESEQLQERYGDHLEKMSLESLLTFRCVLDLVALRFASQGSGDWEMLVQIAINDINVRWLESDPIAYGSCKDFCTECIDGKYVAIQYLNPMISALTDCIECHADY